MSYEIKNRMRGPSTIRVTGADTTGALALTAFSANQTIENVNSVYVTSLRWSVTPATGTLVITRGATVIATLFETGDWKHDELALSNSALDVQSLTVQVTGGGIAMLTVNKQATYNTEAYKL